MGIISATACDHTWRAETLQPPLRLDDTDAARTSRPGFIIIRDIQLPRSFQLRNSAYFVVVNKDRLRFHVSLIHRWEKIADPSQWRVYLEDAHGNRFFPEDVEQTSVKSMTRTFQAIHHRQPISSYPLLLISVYRGVGDYVFHSRGIFSSSLRSLTLVMERPAYGYIYRYSWQFADPDKLEKNAFAPNLFEPTSEPEPTSGASHSNSSH